jgi:hypothetical protein
MIGMKKIDVAVIKAARSCPHVMLGAYRMWGGLRVEAAIVEIASAIRAARRRDFAASAEVRSLVKPTRGYRDCAGSNQSRRNDAADTKALSE